MSDSLQPYGPCQAPLSMGFSRQEYWSGLPFPPRGDLPNPGIEPASLTSSALADKLLITSTTWEAPSKVPESETASRSVSPALWPHGLYSPWNSPGQNTRVGSLSLLQGIFPTQGLNPGLLLCRWIFCQLSHKVSSRILEWVTQPFSSEYSRPRNRTGVSCIAGGFFTSWDTWEVSDLGKGKFWASPVAQW